MDGADFVSYRFRKFKSKENTVLKSRNVVLHSWVFFYDFYYTQCSFAPIIEKENIHDRVSCFITNRMAKYFYYRK